MVSEVRAYASSAAAETSMTHIGFTNPKRCLKNHNFKNPRLRKAAILKIKKLQYLQNRFVDFSEILHTDTSVLWF